MINDSVSKYVDPSCFCEVEGVHCMGTWETKGFGDVQPRVSRDVWSGFGAQEATLNPN